MSQRFSCALLLGLCLTLFGGLLAVPLLSAASGPEEPTHASAEVELSEHSHDVHGAHGGGHGAHLEFPLELDSYDDAHIESLWGKLVHRIEVEPFNLIATLIFFSAILHTFLANSFLKISHRIEHAHEEKWAKLKETDPELRVPVSLRATIFHFLGEIEAVFGIWLVPLISATVLYYGASAFSHGEGMVEALLFGWDHVLHYFHAEEHYLQQGEYVNRYSEAIFVVVIMAMASTTPIIRFSEDMLRYVARIGGETPLAWWFSILTVAPLLGSFITEPAAMTVAALLLGRQFYALNPSNRLKFATLGLLFVNVSVGGTLTNFAAPPVLMVQSIWGFDIMHMLTNFGWKAATGILIANVIYLLIFLSEFRRLNQKAREREDESAKTFPIPIWVTGLNLLFIGWTVLVLHHHSLVIMGFLFFMAFTQATGHHHDRVNLRGPILVGFFLAALVTHGGFQSWWIAPVLSSLDQLPLFFGSTILTAFNDNAAITFLASLVPDFNPNLGTELARNSSYAVVAGAVTGGGLTVIANAPNPAGQSLLQRYFQDGINPLGLFLGAALPTAVMACCFLLL
ncbi:MAG: putative Na+/H+ antiporter [Opitutales bacterium]